jgi:hypothetical protein
MSKDIYYEKYLKYKIKYLKEKERLSQQNQDGGFLERIGSKLLGSLKGNLVYLYNSNDVKGTKYENLKINDEISTIDLDKVLANKAYSGNDNDNKLTLVTLLGTKTSEVGQKALEEAKKKAVVVGQKAAEEIKKQAAVIGQKAAEEIKKQAAVVGKKTLEEAKKQGVNILKSVTSEIAKSITSSPKDKKLKGGDGEVKKQLLVTIPLDSLINSNEPNSFIKIRNMLFEKTGLDVDRMAVIKYNPIGKSVVVKLYEIKMANITLLQPQKPQTTTQTQTETPTTLRKPLPPIPTTQTETPSAPITTTQTETPSAPITTTQTETPTAPITTTQTETPTAPIPPPIPSSSKTLKPNRPPPPPPSKKIQTDTPTTASEITTGFLGDIQKIKKCTEYEDKEKCVKDEYCMWDTDTVECYAKNQEKIKKLKKERLKKERLEKERLEKERAEKKNNDDWDSTDDDDDEKNYKKTQKKFDEYKKLIQQKK